MMTFTIITLVFAVAAIFITTVFNIGTISIDIYPGILIGSSYTEYNVDYTKKDDEDKKVFTDRLSELKFNIICLSVTIIWVKS